MGIPRRLSKMQASTFLATFLFISVFWCQANADDHEDEDEEGVHLHFHVNQNDQDDDATLPPPTTTVSDEEPTYNKRFRHVKPYASKPYPLDYPPPVYPRYRPRPAHHLYNKYRDAEPWKQWSPSRRDPCDAVACRPQTNNINNEGFAPGFNNRGFGRPWNEPNSVTGCCSASIVLDSGNILGR